MNAHPDPLEDLLETCKDLDGTLHEGKVRAALAWAYRRGFDEMRGRLPANPECSVSIPAHVVTPLEAAAAEQRIQARVEELRQGRVPGANK